MPLEHYEYVPTPDGTPAFGAYAETDMTPHETYVISVLDTMIAASEATAETVHGTYTNAATGYSVIRKALKQCSEVIQQCEMIADSHATREMPVSDATFSKVAGALRASDDVLVTVIGYLSRH